MLELLIMSVCMTTNFKENACGNAVDAYHKGNKDIQAFEKHFNEMYLKPLPDDVKYLGGAANILYNKRLKVGLYKGIFIDLREYGQEKEGSIGYTFHW